MTTQPDAPADATQPADEQPTDPPADTGPVPGAAGEDVGRTFDLSDEAAAALYPDVDSGPPPQVTPDMLQVPLPLAQRESALLDIVRMYGSKQASWTDTLNALASFEYAPMPQAAGSPTGPTAGQWYGDVESDAFAPAPPNTWPQLQEAADAGLITQAEFDQVLAARAGQTDTQAGDQGAAVLAAAGDGGNTGGSSALPAGPTEGKAWSDAARKAAYEARLANLRERGVISPNPDQPPPTAQWFPDPREPDTHHYVTPDGGHAEVARDEDHEDTWYIDVTHPDDSTDDHTEDSLHAAKVKAEEVLKRGPRARS